MTPPPTPCGNLQCIIVQKQFCFRGTTANSKIVHQLNPLLLQKSLNQRSWKSWLWMGDYIFTEDTYAKIQIIKIACSCHNLAPYLNLLKVICLISLPQLFPMNRYFALIFRKLWLICSMPTVYITWPYANAELHKKRKAKKAGFTSHKHQSISAGDHLVARCNLYVLFSLLKYIWKQIQVKDAVRRRLTFFLTATHLVFWKPCRWCLPVGWYSRTPTRRICPLQYQPLAFSNKHQMLREGFGNNLFEYSLRADSMCQNMNIFYMSKTSTFH